MRVQLAEDVQKLDYPSSFKPWSFILHCCQDGSVVIEVIKITNNIDVKNPILLLWNPSTRESIVLPDPAFPLVDGSCLGLGYDSTSGDYKILKIDNKGRSHKAPGEILALKGGRWRNIDKHPLDITNMVLVCVFWHLYTRHFIGSLLLEIILRFEENILYFI
ncbi:hypothetical protein RND71_009178 [Anisodus tanguticus]|uniref:F-box associated beta-propeller type 3 domain-containing protein n=1 Tax=Anisodus tanguticus TaxID=243964 RepID=A0AAE1SF10_9SOLA|nr:hypothetical protein RND71_009178 [Anisodus tanguticus]